MMRKSFAILKRELRSYFVSPIAYAVTVVWLVWSGLVFSMFADFYAGNPSSGGSDSPLSSFFGATLLFFLPLLVFVPILTMRLIAGEKSSGSYEALLTAPISEWAITLGKYSAALVFYAALWVPSVVYVWITSQYGDVDGGSVITSYLGVFVVGTSFVAVGLLMSALAPNQIVAATLTFLALGMLFVAGIVQYNAQGTSRELLSYMSVLTHMQSFSKGVVDSRALVFHTSIASFCLFCTTRVIEWRRIRT